MLNYKTRSRVVGLNLFILVACLWPKLGGCRKAHDRVGGLF